MDKIDEYHKEINKRYEFASNCIKIDFITNLAKKDNTIEYKKKICSLCKRGDAIIAINKHINNINSSILIEAGIYEYVLLYIINNSTTGFLEAIYNDKLNNIISYFDKTSDLYKKELVVNIIKNKINPQKVAFMSPQELVPENWTDLIKKRELQKFKRENMASTNLYKCYKCGKRKCSVIQIQIRSADEPMTNRITCLFCKNTWDR